MIKKYLILSLISISAYGQVSLQECELSAARYGSQKNIPIEIPADCRDIILQTTSILDTAKTSDGVIKVLGLSNMLLTEKYQYTDDKKLILEQSHFTAGENSLLTRIVAVKYNPSDQKTYVLNESSGNFSVYSYFSAYGGNNAPARKLITDEIQDASHFTVAVETNELIVLSNRYRWIKIFHKDADPDGKKPENSVQLKRQIFGLEKLAGDILSVKVVDSNIVIQTKDQILSLPLI
jgi:hypothetical protein